MTGVPERDGRRLAVAWACVLGLCWWAAGQEAAPAPAPAPEAAPAAPLVANGSFEEESGGIPSGWAAEARSGQGVVTLARAAEGRTGAAGALIESASPCDAVWSATAGVEPGALYRASAWVRTAGVAGPGGAGAYLQVADMPLGRSLAVAGDSEWAEVSVVFDTGAETAVRLLCGLGGPAPASGRALFDDVSLVKVVAASDLRPTVRIDAGAAGPPVSPLIYGQQLEPVGAALEGGLWAEMLRDRKFLHPVGATASPWKPIGGEGVVQMVAEQPFAGAHSPRVTLRAEEYPNGLTQGGLRLRAGRRYVCRMALCGDPAAGPIHVALVWGTGLADRQSQTVDAVSPEYTVATVELGVGADTSDGHLEITGLGDQWFGVGAVSLMPVEHVNGMRPDVLACLTELGASIYRWPGGNASGTWDWQASVGDRDRRAPRLQGDGVTVENNDFGVDEFLAFCAEVQAEPCIAVNAGTGDAGSAARLVEYVTGSPGSPMGQVRATNGRQEPYPVSWWAIGGLAPGDPAPEEPAPEAAAARTAEYAAAMAAVAP